MIEKFRTILSLQQKLNNSLMKNKKVGIMQVRCALIEEVGETIKLLNWKWWKTIKEDKERIKSELVDILHFILTHYLLVYKNIEEISYILDRIFRLKEEILTKNYSNSRLILEFVEKMFKDFDLATLFYFILVERYFESFEDLYKDYIFKNIINKFRNENGYEKNKYKYKSVEEKIKNKIDIYRYIDENGNFILDRFGEIKDLLEEELKCLKTKRN